MVAVNVGAEARAEIATEVGIAKQARCDMNRTCEHGRYMHVQIAFALPHAQTVLTLKATVGCTIADVIAASGILARHAELHERPLCAGIFGRRVSLDTPLCGGERIELYRPLHIEPKQARRMRATGKVKDNGQRKAMGKAVRTCQSNSVMRK